MTDYEALRVTTDPDVEAALLDRVDELSSQALAEYAHSLGLYPPGFEDGKNPPVSLAWPPGTDYDSPGMLIWDLGDGDEANESPDQDGTDLAAT